MHETEWFDSRRPDLVRVENHSDHIIDVYGSDDKDSKTWDKLFTLAPGNKKPILLNTTRSKRYIRVSKRVSEILDYEYFDPFDHEVKFAFTGFQLAPGAEAYFPNEVHIFEKPQSYATVDKDSGKAQMPLVPVKKRFLAKAYRTVATSALPNWSDYRNLYTFDCYTASEGVNIRTERVKFHNPASNKHQLAFWFNANKDAKDGWYKATQVEAGKTSVCIQVPSNKRYMRVAIVLSGTNYNNWNPDTSPPVEVNFVLECNNSDPNQAASPPTPLENLEHQRLE